MASVISSKLNLCQKNVVPSIVSIVRKIHTTTVDNRYWADRMKEGYPLKWHGKNMQDPLHRRGLLPHDPDAKSALPMPIHAPKNKFSEKRAVRGQNDYIDILGDGDIHPTEVAYDVPDWLRVGRRLNEFEMLLIKKKHFSKVLQEKYPKQHEKVEKRIRYLYKRLNYKGRDYYVR